MVVDGAQVEQMLLGEDGALARRARRGRCSSTCRRSRPATARSLAERLSGEGHAFVDAPVTGSSPKAEAGTLTIMVGGADADVARARPLFEVMGEKIVHAGEAGQGQTVKVLSQGVTAVNCATLAQAITVGRRIGVDLDALLDVMTGGSSDSTMRELKGQAMVDHDYPRAVQARAHAQGRAAVPGGVARRRRLVPVRRRSRGELYSAGVGRGLGQQDFAAVLEVVEGLTGDAAADSPTPRDICHRNMRILQGDLANSRLCA